MPELDRSKIHVGLSHYSRKGDTDARLGLVDCSYGGKHGEAHVASELYPGRFVCCVCHPPAFLLAGGA